MKNPDIPTATYILRYAQALPNYTHAELEPIRDLVALLTEEFNIKL